MCWIPRTYWSYNWKFVPLTSSISPSPTPYLIFRNKSKLLTRFSRTWLCLVLIVFFPYLTPSHPQIYQAHSHPSTSILKAHIFFLEHPYPVLCIASTLRILWVSPISSPPWRCFPEHPIENSAFLLPYYLLILNIILNIKFNNLTLNIKLIFSLNI